MAAIDECPLELVATDDYFRNIHGRTVSNFNKQYLLPVDDDEVKRSEIHHKLVQFLFKGRNYVGPVKEALQFGQQRRVLDLGTGCGSWAIDIADEFPRVEVVAVDLAPIQPRQVPPNCTFELCDLDDWPIPYPDSHFDFIHARSLHIGIHDYPRLLHEIARLLRPGGLVLLIEPTLSPCPPPPPPTPPTPEEQAQQAQQQPQPPQPHQQQPFQPRQQQHPHMAGWTALWDTYRACLRRLSVDVTVPERLPDLLAATPAFENIIVRDGNIPVGFWPQDPYLLSVGQLQWMDYELFLPALRPLFLCSGLPPSTVDHLIKDAQNDLYYPSYPPSTLLHIAHASKRY